MTCWNGRAFVQPCAPGLLFSPDTLECDFPNKVECYGGEIADFSSESNEDETVTLQSRANIENDGEWRPTCPTNLNGLIAHPSDCTKYFQCAHGISHLMVCGPGTVFNPAMITCDHPKNVKGCEGTVILIYI